MSDEVMTAGGEMKNKREKHSQKRKTQHDAGQHVTFRINTTLRELKSKKKTRETTILTDNSGEVDEAEERVEKYAKSDTKHRSPRQKKKHKQLDRPSYKQNLMAQNTSKGGKIRTLTAQSVRQILF